MLALGHPVLALGEAPPAHVVAQVLLGQKPVQARRRVRIPEERGEGIAQRDKRLEAREEERRGGAQERDEVQAEQHRQQHPIELHGAHLLIGGGRLAHAILDLRAINEDLGVAVRRTGQVRHAGGVRAEVHVGSRHEGVGLVVAVDDEQDVLVLGVEGAL